MFMQWDAIQTLIRRSPFVCLALAICPSFICGCGAGGATQVTNSSLSFERPREYLPTSRESLQGNVSPPIEGTLPLGIGAQVNLFFSEADEQIDGFIGNVVKPMRKGEVFASTPYQIDYAIRDRGDAFKNDVALDRISFRSHYDIRIGMTRRFHNFGDMLEPAFWLGVGRFTPTPTRDDPEAPSRSDALLEGKNEPLAPHDLLDRPLVEMDEVLGFNRPWIDRPWIDRPWINPPVQP